ncbi:MAG: ABC transporter permease [Acidobacteria bacterium]|nr:ABC transporter permease [Acidobacteriota bacterium]
MLRFLARRALMLVVTLLVASFAIYSALYLAPGNPIATLTGGRTPSPQAIALLEERFHLNDPFMLRFGRWIGGAVQGDLGVSIQLRQDVSTLIAQRIGTTVQLVLFSSLIIMVVGISLGLLGGLRKGPIDSIVIGLTTISAAVPSFVASIILLSVFAVNLGWFPALGGGKGFLDQVRHLTLPAVALAFSSVALVARITRASVREELGREHVQTAISRGIPYRLVVRRHVMRNAAIPITTVVGITIASLFAASAVVERAFALNGIGSYLIQAALSKDMAVVQGISLVIVAVFVVANAVVDLLYAVLDPRVKLGESAR